jgi:hypothetical protein
MSWYYSNPKSPARARTRQECNSHVRRNRCQDREDADGRYHKEMSAERPTSRENSGEGSEWADGDPWQVGPSTRAHTGEQFQDCPSCHADWDNDQSEDLRLHDCRYCCHLGCYECADGWTCPMESPEQYHPGCCPGPRPPTPCSHNGCPPDPWPPDPCPPSPCQYSPSPVPQACGAKVAVDVDAEYVASLPGKPVHFAHFVLPFHTFFPCSHWISDVKCRVEYTNHELIDPRTISKVIILHVQGVAG